MRSPPDFADHAEPRPKRFLIAAGTSRYKNMPEGRQLPSVKQDLSRIVKLFEGEFGYERVLAGLGENPPHDYFRTQLSAWLKEPERTASDIIVLYYSGHGAPEAGEHYLLMTDSDENDFAATAFPTASIGKMLRKTKIRHMMVIMDTCHAAMGGSDFGAVAHEYVSSLKADYGEDFGLYTLAAARPKEEAREGAFSAAFDRALRNPPSACGNAEQQFLSSYDKLVEAINEEFRANGVRQRASISSILVQSAPSFIPNIRHRPRKEPTPENRQEYRDKLHKMLSAELELFPLEIAELFSAFQVSDDPKERKKSLVLTVNRLLDDEDSIPLLNKLIRGLARKGARIAVGILENCIDRILPFHFAPGEVSNASSYLNHKGGGIIKGIVTTTGARNW